MNCDYCNKSFTSKSSLTYHQKTAKYCLKLRGETDINSDFVCEHCEQKFTRKFNLTSHRNSCKNKILNESQDNLLREIQHYKEYTTKLENKIKDLEKFNQDLLLKVMEKNSIVYQNNNNLEDNRTINNSNNNSNNKMIDNRILNMIPMNLTKDMITKCLEEKFNEAYLLKGQKGVAEFMLENVLITGEKEDKKYLMKCTDPSRKVFITLDEDGKIVKDVNADNFTRMISGPVKEVSHKLFQQIQDRYFQVYENTPNELEEDDEESKTLSFENERLDYATNRVVEISKLKNNNTEFVKGLIPPLSS